jgi:hypothetical protein
LPGGGFFAEGRISASTRASIVSTGPGENLLTIDASGSDPTFGAADGMGGRIFNIDDGNNRNILTAQISGLTLTESDGQMSAGATSQARVAAAGDSAKKMFSLNSPSLVAPPPSNRNAIQPPPSAIKNRPIDANRQSRTDSACDSQC